MKIVIPIAQGTLCMHFGHCEHFAMMEIDESGKIVSKTLMVPPPHQPGLLPKWLAEEGANVIIAGGMGMRAQQIFSEQGIKVIVGAMAGTPEELTEAFLSDSLVTGQNVCDH